ncbi:hypothetical protein Sango_3105900 [Sesamum angolense]|uniref:Integrase zinc-binding domain-containing protein n=1 Tax=Sesamum angolense TaxID=2727404 RepID=A0AAE1TA67_9LAMI|nr:hypothetical protein Sango_3105900 [Sesamum angolense]
MPTEWELSDDLPDEDVLVIEVYTSLENVLDRASIKEGAGAGVVFVTSEEDDDEKVQAMEEPHSGVCGAHQSGPKLYLCTKRMSYYWPTMVKDCIDYARRCQAYQFHANLIHQPPERCILLLPHDHSMLGFGCCGPITESSGGHLYILAATYYFSKWAEAVPLKEMEK